MNYFSLIGLCLTYPDTEKKHPLRPDFQELGRCFRVPGTWHYLEKTLSFNENDKWKIIESFVTFMLAEIKPLINLLRRLKEAETGLRKLGLISKSLDDISEPQLLKTMILPT